MNKLGFFSLVDHSVDTVWFFNSLGVSLFFLAEWEAHLGSWKVPPSTPEGALNGSPKGTARVKGG